MTFGLRMLAAVFLTLFVVGVTCSGVLHAGLINDPCAKECHPAESHSKGEPPQDVCDCLCHMAVTALVQRLADQQKAPLVLTSQYSISHLTPPDGPISEILLPPQLA